MLKIISEYEDSLDTLNHEGSLQSKLASIHEVITATFEFVDRIAVAIYEKESDCLKTFLASCNGDNLLRHYEARLSDAPSLQEIVNTGRPRIINNLGIFSGSGKEHTRMIGKLEYAASYTMPIYQNSVFYGFVFFNSTEPDVFEESTLHQMDLFGHMISLMVMNELTVAYTLNTALKTTGDVVQHRDPETGSHIDRMSRYARLIAQEIAEQCDLNDEYIEHIGLFSPLHDIGKVGIPDNILLKPGKLSSEEFETMKTHTIKGREMVDTLLQNFGMDGFRHVSILRNIAQYHHEFMNGSGYPYGLKGDEIPLEARIVAVADIFDALSSERPYKKAWSNDETFAALKEMAGTKLDSDCVNALIKNIRTVENIQRLYREDRLG